MAQYGRIKGSFLRRFMTLKHGIPSHDAFSDLSMQWAEAMKPYLGPGSKDVIAIDGKALRQSFADAVNRQPLHLVHAFAAGSKLVLVQVKVKDKSNELTAIPALLDLHYVRGQTVTLDAMHTQRESAKAITGVEGD